MAVKIRRKTFRQKIKEQDEFISFSQKTLLYVKKNSGTILLVSALAAAVIASIGFFINWSSNQKRAFFSKMYDDIMLANNNFKDNQYDEASKLFSTIKKDNEKSGLFKEIAEVGIGYSHMEKKEYDESIKIFEDLVGRVDLQYPKEELHKNLALLYEKTGKEDMAVEIFKKIVELYPQSSDIAIYMKKLSKSGQFKHP